MICYEKLSKNRKNKSVPVFFCLALKQASFTQEFVIFFSFFNVELQELLRIVIIGSRIPNFCHCSPEYCFLSAQSLTSAQILVNPASPFTLKTRIP